MSNYIRVLEELHPLVFRAWDQYNKYVNMTFEYEMEQKRFVVKDTMPILYFGDMKAYFQSKIRIVTAALNPSDQEFPLYDRFLRFPKMREILSSGNLDGFPSVYLESLNKYFLEKPYTKWFGNKNGGLTFEPILNGMGGSFWTDANSNIAIHTDVITPLPTNPTCSGLRKAKLTGSKSEVISELAVSGSSLWWELIKLLKPDVVILAISKPDFKVIGLPNITTTDWVSIYRFPDKKYDVRMLNFNLSEGHNTLFISGSRGFETPYGRLAAQDRREIGRRILGQLKG